MTFGEWLKENRIRAGLSQDKLAELTGLQDHKVTKGYISNLERGYDRNKAGQPIRPNENLVEAFARALQTNINEARLAAGYAERKSEQQTAENGNDIIDDLRVLFYGSEKWSARKRAAVVSAIRKEIAFINSHLDDNEPSK